MCANPGLRWITTYVTLFAIWWAQNRIVRCYNAFDRFSLNGNKCLQSVAVTIWRWSLRGCKLEWISRTSLSPIQRPRIHTDFRHNNARVLLNSLSRCRSWLLNMSDDVQEKVDQCDNKIFGKHCWCHTVDEHRQISPATECVIRAHIQADTQTLTHTYKHANTSLARERFLFPCDL